MAGRRFVGINMKKSVIIFLMLALTVGIFGCAAQPSDTQPPQDPNDLQPRRTEQTTEAQENIFTAEAEDDYVRYIGGGIRILLESGFVPTTAEEGYIIYTNGFLTVVLSRTDDYDAQMLAQSGFDMEKLTEEEYGSILVDANNLPTDSLFYDWMDNVCLTQSGKDSGGSDYESYSVIKKDTATNTFWLIQFIGNPKVYEPYSVYFPEWAASAVFY